MQLKPALVATIVALAIGRGASAQEPPPAEPPAPPAEDTPASSPGSDAPQGSEDDHGEVRPPSETPPVTSVEDRASPGTPITGTGRVGVYTDSDHTTVWRALALLAKTWGKWTLNTSVGVDAVSSASVEVRTSPALGAVDVMTSASGRSTTSGGVMTDTRYQLTAGGGWNDSSGHTVNVTSAVAKENDYASVNGGVNGSYDILGRTTTLLGGVTVTDNWISSILDRSLHHKMASLGWSAGIARVLTRDDAIRLRYDGKLERGYIASPYRSVRFGDWTTTTNEYGQVMFANTIGDPGGLPERLPEGRTSSALSFEWVHSLALGVGLHTSVRGGRDSWGISSITPALELRIARPGWRLQLGYRFYAQTRADFFETKYTMDPATYSYWTSDKELGQEIGHLGDVSFQKVLSDAEGPNDRRVLLFLHADAFRYAYPDFAFLSSRTSVFLEAGLTWEL